jgi:tripartite-type tricarboxylate transporter receptor subunit TctC
MVSAPGLANQLFLVKVCTCSAKLAIGPRENYLQRGSNTSAGNWRINISGGNRMGSWTSLEGVAMQRRTFTSQWIASLIGLACGSALAQLPNTHTVRMTVPYPPGGTIDQQARLLVPVLRSELGQDVIIDNVAGAAGAVGLQRMLNAPPNGMELAIATDSDAILVPMVNPDVRYQASQFRVLGLVVKAPMVLLASKQVEVTDLRSLLETGRTSGPPKLRVGSYGIGSNSHLCAEDFSQQTGLPIIHVPYRGIAPIFQDMFGGHADLAFMPLVGPVLENIKSGALRALAISSAERDTRIPLVPTVAQAGGPATFLHSSWSAVVVQSAVPEPKARELHQTIQRALLSSEFQREMARVDSLPAPAMSFEQAQAFLTEESARYRRLADDWLARKPAAPR